MRVLYIGGTGEISTACVWRSVEAGHKVAVFNRGRTEEPLPPGVRHIPGDLKDPAAYEALGTERFDAVCQFLAYDLATARRDAEVFAGRCGQYVFISTASAYQKPPTRVVITEDVPLANPFWPYSQTKADMEAFLLRQHADGRLPVTIVRPSHTLRTRFPGGIGRGDDWAWRILHGRPLLVHGDGTALWTLTHSEDFAVPFVGLLGNPKALGEAFHITRHMKSYPWDAIFQAMGRALGAEPRLVHVPTDTLVRYNPEWAGPLLGDKTWSVLFDNSKVMGVVGRFECRVSLDEAMRRSAECYRRRAAVYQPDERLHTLFDRIASNQEGLGLP
ncbi:MAG TPA: SDR family oxidoreductase [Planctomycetota bacterium]|nr:SDR family oxidoreductase [Planctomycetota bacterium]HRR79956.1 SDR family oxidoreductase [Planctomycetota bacterium]HRT95748.1 SDR family oxidoreductase [Planctomycetota bacterium]